MSILFCSRQEQIKKILYEKKNKISHVALDSKTGSRTGTCNLQILNNFHSIFGEMAHCGKSFAPRYCDEYLAWISWMAKMMRKTVEEKVMLLKRWAQLGERQSWSRIV